MDKIKKIAKSINNLNKSENRGRLKQAERIWIENTPKIHALNYLWYRYFTNNFIYFILSEEFKYG